MQSADAQKYCSLMAEIKRRTLVVNNFAPGRAVAIYKATTIELVYLQFRKVLELIAMSSLLANAKALSRVQTNIQRHWNAKELWGNWNSSG
jgi:hypothetical protein